MDFFNINDGPSSGPSPAAAHVALTQEQLHEGIFDKINDASSGGPKSKKAYIRPPKPITHLTLDKLGGHTKFSDSAAPTPPPTAAFKQESFLDKIGDAATSHQVAVQSSHSTPPSVTKEDPEGFLDKIWDILHERNKPATILPALKEDEGSLDKVVGDVIVMSKNDEPPEKPHGLLKTLDSAPGDRVAGDQKEGKLDKAIDLFQEHTLKEEDPQA